MGNHGQLIMKRLALLMLLMAVPAMAQRPPKVICSEQGPINFPDSKECVIPDIDDIVELKKLFNVIQAALDRALHLKSEYLPPKVTGRFTASTAKIERLQLLKDTLEDQELKDLMQDRINNVISLRDDRDSQEPGSDRARAAAIGPVIAGLNQQLNDIEAVIRIFLP